MIPLPPGCSVTYSIWIDIDNIDNSVLEWFTQIGGETKRESFHDHRGKLVTKDFVRYGNNKWCHHHSGGLFGTRLHFSGKDTSIATVFLLKFMQKVLKHNMQETMERFQRDYKELAN